MANIQNFGWRFTFINFLIIFLIFLTYAVIRYNIFQGVAIQHIPLYVSNKAIALTSVVLIGISFILGPLAKFWPKFASKLYLRKYFGLFGFGMAAIHVLISLIIFNPAYYQKFFTEAGKLTLEGELSMLFGTIAFFIFSIVAITSVPSIAKTMGTKQWLTIQRLGYLAFFLVMLHVFAMGFEGWLKPAGWPGGLLPMSLLAFIIITFVLLMRLIVA